MLTFYILIWPTISAVVLVLIVTTFLRELRQAKKEGRKVV
ncbi:putative transporter small subunit [Ruegeria hyattellae]